jgi:hypothetical protein
MFNDLVKYSSCVFACSGPSLNKVDVFSLGIPVVAISTAIRSIPNPNYWVYCDFLNEMHGDEGKNAYVNENIVKIIQDGKSSKHLSGKNLHPYRSESSNRNFEPSQHLFDFSRAFARGPHKTVTFALQWAHSVGVKNIIWAGNDLLAESMENKYSYATKQFDLKKKHNFKKTLDDVYKTLVDWYPLAKKKGYSWYSWQCGDVFERIVPKFSNDILEQIKNNETKTEENPVEAIQETIQPEKEKFLQETNTQYQREVDTYLRLMSKVKKL